MYSLLQSSKIKLTHGQHIEPLCSSFQKEKYSTKNERPEFQTDSSNAKKHQDSRVMRKSQVLTGTVQELFLNKETQTEICNSLDLLKKSSETDNSSSEKLKMANLLSKSTTIGEHPCESPPLTELPKDKNNTDDSCMEEHLSATPVEDPEEQGNDNQISNDSQKYSNENGKNKTDGEFTISLEDSKVLQEEHCDAIDSTIDAIGNSDS